MLKKSLICVAILALAMPAFAADTFKFHGWDKTTTVTYHWNDICTMDVVLDVGYWINIDCAGDIKVTQDSLLGDPFYSYSGCSDAIVVQANFDATLKASAASASAAGGSWSATFGASGPDTIDIPAGETTVSVCVAGTGVEIGELAQADNVKVATVTISVLPQNP